MCAVFEIGTSLREARSRRQIGLPQAEQATKIRAKYLRALEDERFDELPSETYVKGFLRTYADYLGLDGQLYVDEYNSRFVTGADDHEPRVRRSASGSGNRKAPPRRHPPAARTHHAAVPPRAFLEIEAVNGSSYVAVHRGGPAGPLLFAGTIDKGSLEPFSAAGGKHFWVNVSSPENLLILVDGKRVPLSGLHPAVLTVTPSGVRSA